MIPHNAEMFSWFHPWFKLWCWQKGCFNEIDIDLTIGQVELLWIRSKIGTFADIVDLCPKRKLQFIDNYSHEHWYKCVDAFSIHKQLVKTNLHEITLPEFHSMFCTYNVLLGQRVCMKCFKRVKDNVAASTITIENEVEMDKKEEKD